MDQEKTGKFIAKLRREKNLTQEELGQRLGVSNKTVSRWENGNYMPDVEMLRLLAKEFGVSMEELLDGETKTAEKPPKKPDPFTNAERADFWRRNWKRENLGWFIFWGVIVGLFILFGLVFLAISFWLVGFGFSNTLVFGCIVLFVAGIFSYALYIYFYNKMCIYVDNNAYKLSED